MYSAEPNADAMSWGLVVATYNREKILPLCLQLAVQQTRKPEEIIVIDASASWDQTWAKIQQELVAEYSEIRWVYQNASIPSITAQRNQGLALATTDIVFLIDDDSLLFPSCAEEVMRVYESDSQKTISSVAIGEVSHTPSEMIVQDVQKEVGYSRGLRDNLNKARSFQWIWKNVLLMDIEALWIPYDGEFPQHELSAKVQALNVQSIFLCRGCQMTFRREAILKEPFDQSLLYYAVGEDLDVINRVTRFGALVLAKSAHLHHYASSGGRFPRFLVSALAILNQAYFLRKHSNDLRRDTVKFYVLLIRRVLADLIKDGLGKRFSFPQVRGDIYAMFHSWELIKIPNPQCLDKIYPEMQKNLLEVTGVSRLN